MPVTITTDLVDVNLSEATTNYAVIGTWGTAIAASPDTYVQASNTVGGRVSANSAWAHTTIPTTTVDLTIGERHVFQWLKCISIPQLDTKANGALGITISSDATPTLVGTSPSNGPSNSKTWYVGGNTDALSGWVCYVVDPTSTPTLTLGTPAVTAIQRIGIRGKVVGTVGGGAVKPVNIVFDATRYGTGLTYSGDTGAGGPGNFTSILDIAMNSTNAWGILTSDSSIYFGAGKFNFGTTGQTATSSFKDIGQLFVWRNFPVATTFYSWLIRGNSSFNTTFQLGNYTAGLISDGSVVKGAGDLTSSTFATWSLNVGTNTTVNLYGSQFSELYRGILQSTTSVRSCTFKNFGNITINGATIDSCTFQDLKTTTPISATYGIVIDTTIPIITNNTFNNCATAVFWNVNADTIQKLSGSTFNSGGGGHAIELSANTPSTITLTNVIFNGYTGGTPGSNDTPNSGSVDAAIYNNSGKAITINITNGTTPAVRNGAGATTVVNAGAVTVQVTVQTIEGAAIEDARVLMIAAAGGGLPFNATGITITRSGSVATVAHTSHSMLTNDKVQIKGANEIDYNGVFTITKINDNSYSYTVGGTPATPATGTIKSTYTALSDISSGGTVSMSRSFALAQPISGKVRKGSSIPFYKTSTLVGTISTTNGLSLTIQLIPDE